MLLLLQALAVVPAAAAAAALGRQAGQTMHHDCGDAGMRHESGQSAAVSSAMCASHCAAALLSMPLAVSVSSATVECPQTTETELQSRSDIPPTPPPIV